MKYSKKYINDYKFQFKITTIISIILIMISIYCFTIENYMILLRIPSLILLYVLFLTVMVANGEFFNFLSYESLIRSITIRIAVLLILYRAAFISYTFLLLNFSIVFVPLIIIIIIFHIEYYFKVIKKDRSLN